MGRTTQWGGANNFSEGQTIRNLSPPIFVHRLSFVKPQHNVSVTPQQNVYRVGHTRYREVNANVSSSLSLQMFQIEYLFGL